MKTRVTEKQLKKLVRVWLDINFDINQLERFKNKNFPSSIFFKKDGEVVIEIDSKNKIYRFSRSKIWSFMEEFFGLDYYGVQNNLRQWMMDNFDYVGYTPNYVDSIREIDWERLSD